MRNARACGSLAQHSGDFVFMFLCVLTVLMTPPRQLQTDEIVGGLATESKQILMQPIPKRVASARGCTARKIESQRFVAGARHILAQLLLVRREDADAAPTPRNRHKPLLGVGRRLES